MTTPSLRQSYDAFPRVEAAFHAALDESLHPRGPDLLYDIVGRLGLPANANVLDLGCGVGRHAAELAKRFDFAVYGVDPVPRNAVLAHEALREAATRRPEPAIRMHVLLALAEWLPLRSSSIDLIWCRELISIVADLDALFSECRRVLQAGGRMLIYNNFVSDQRELDAAWCTSLGMVRTSQQASHVEAVFMRHGFQIEQLLDLGGEFGEHAEETSGEPGRRLLHAARLLRDPERYIARFGRANYEIMLGDCLWHVYRMIGKLGARVYLLRHP